MILIVDNHDSFTHLLGDAIAVVAERPRIIRNDDPDLLVQIESPELTALIASPGPKDPTRTPMLLRVLRERLGRTPILGVCLGHQALATLAGGEIERCPTPLHGAHTPMTHSGSPLFAGVPNPSNVGRYHSLSVRPGSLSSEWDVLATSSDGVIMALGDSRRCAYGVQFHPESFLTPHGTTVLSNFFRLARSWLHDHSATSS
jgi:para-aminobenzoate synthetase component 2